MVKREPEELCSAATKKVKKEESTNLDSLTRQEPTGLKQKANDTKCKQYAKLERIQNPTARNLLKEKVIGNTSQMKRNIDPLYGGRMENYNLRSLLLRDMPFRDHIQLAGLTGKETSQHEIWWIFKFLNPSKAELDLFYRSLCNSVKVCISEQTAAKRTFHNRIRRAVDRQLNKTPNYDVLYAFATYFRESQQDVKACFPNMTRQEVYDTCLLRYFARTCRERKNYEERALEENAIVSFHRLDMFGRSTWLTNPKVNHLSKEDIEAYIKQMPITIEVAPSKEGGVLKQGQIDRQQFVNVLDIKGCSPMSLINQINCKWKALTEKENFQYELTRAFEGAISVADIDVAWRNLGNKMRVKNLEQTMSKRFFFAMTKKKMEKELNKGLLFSFSSYFCEFENVIKTEFPSMTEVEVRDTCLLRYIAAPKGYREIYEILSTREECKKLCSSRFRNIP